jgi:hypothetical protein
MTKIDNEERIKTLPEKRYKEIFGVKKETFDTMLEILKMEFAKMHEHGGKPPELSTLDKLLITFGYWREYRTYRNIAFDYGVSKSAIGNSVRWVEDTLIKNGTFSLPSKRLLSRGEEKLTVAVVDVTEQEIERPKKNRKSGIQVKRNVIPLRRKSS